MKWKKWGILIAILAVFVGLRTFNITHSFWFFGDLGRDLFVLQEWAGNLLRPPLLGPQTSVVSFNQSAWYYYYLFPFFLLSGHSVYSTLIATLFLYAAMMVGAFVVFRKKRHRRMILALLFLIAIHPQFVLQHRYVWNPSLVTPFLLAGFFAWWKYQYQKKNVWLAILAGSLSVAVGLNFSLIPTSAVMVGLFVYEQRANRQAVRRLVVFGILANLLIHAPTLVFEMRHGFLLARNLPTQELLQQEPQLFSKIAMLFEHIFLPTQYGPNAARLGVAVLVGVLFLVQRSQRLQNSWVMMRALHIASLSAVILLAAPFRVHEHYVFGVLTFVLVALARVPKPILWWVLLGAAALYLQPYYWRLYAQPAPHSVHEQRACMQLACDLVKQQSLEPIFVNTQSASHNHQAREYVFWLREMGCQAVDTQEFLTTPTQYMAVVADRAEFENGKTGYYELSQFGPAEELEKITCTDDLAVHLLGRRR